MIEYLRQMDPLNVLLAPLIFYLILLFIPSKNPNKRIKALKVSRELENQNLVREILKKERREEVPFFVGFVDSESRPLHSYVIKLSVSGLPVFSVSKFTLVEEQIVKRVIGLKDNPTEKKSFQETFKITTKNQELREELNRSRSLQELIIKLFETGISEFEANDGTISIEVAPKESEESELIAFFEKELPIVFEKALPIVFNLAEELLKAKDGRGEL